MTRRSLALNKRIALWVTVLATVGAGRLPAQLDGLQAIGETVTLPGMISELFVDEARGLLYAASFTGGRVHVVSMSTLQPLSSFSTSPIKAGLSGMAVSPNGRWMVATNQPVTNGVIQLSGIAIINLNDPSDRRHIAFDEVPLGVAFGIDNNALVVTTDGLYILDPDDGGARKIFSLTDADIGEGGVTLPVSPPSTLSSMRAVSLASSGDGRWIFGVSEQFVFSYQIRQPVGTLTIRTTDTMISAPTFQQVSASRDGSYFMAGQLLMTNDLRIIADQPEAPGDTGVIIPRPGDDAVFTTEPIGGTGIDSDIATVYASFVDLESGNGNVFPRYGELLVMDADNLYVRRRIRLVEGVRGRIIPAANGRDLFAVSESGVMRIPFSEMSEFPVIDAPLSQRHLLYQFDFCTREPITKTIRLENPTGGQPAKFSLSTAHFPSSSRPGVTFEPHQGVTPADVRVTIDPGAIGPVQGTTEIPVLIETDAINTPSEILLIANLRDVDQRGNFVPEPGHFVSVVGDPWRDQFYVLDRLNYRVIAYDHDKRVIGTFRTGNTPTGMALDRGGNFLVVANSRGENVSIIDLGRMALRGKVFFSWQLLQQGLYPAAVAASNRSVVVGAQTAGGDWKLSFLTLPSGAISTPEALGIYTNVFSSALALAAHPDGDEVLVAEELGPVHLWESTSQRLLISQNGFAENFGELGGAVGAARDYYIVDNHILSRSLVPMASYPDETASQESSGFAVLPDGTGVRSVRPIAQVDTGALQQLDPRRPSARLNSVRMAEPPPERAAEYPWVHTLTSLRDGRLISTSSAGIVEFPVGYHSGSGTPRISAITNAADYTRGTASGGLVSIFGERLSDSTTGAVSSPLPTKLDNVCITANGAPLPVLYVSPGQINAQMMYGSSGPASIQVHTESGVSDVFMKQMDTAAPAIFGVTGPSDQRFAAIFRENNTLSTLSNPLRPNEVAVAYLTGGGDVTPIAVAGHPASGTILSETSSTPVVDIGGVSAEIQYSGLTPGFVGLYQINFRLPGFVPLGLQVPLTISMGGNSTTVNVRIVE